jgi:diaminopimelate epimerase
MRITKHHGLGNDFLVVLDRAGDQTIDADLARSLCDRRRGVGADGLILARPDGEGAVARMTLWNADGSRAELSGNGLRCLGQALLRAGWVAGEHVVLTDAGPRRLRVVERGRGATDVLAVEMGSAAVVELPEGLDAVSPAADERLAVDVGNPHVVLIGGAAADGDPTVIGPAIEALVPGGTNVHLVRVVGPDAISLRIWERGAGATEACGSGAVASAWAARRLGLVSGRAIEVVMPGGTVRVVVDDPLVLEGPATLVADIEVES